MRAVSKVVWALGLLAAWAPAVRAQQPSATTPPQGLSGAAGFGLSLTQGNTDTLNISATDDSIYDPKTNNVMKWSALYLRGKQNGVLAVNRVSGMFRDELTVNHHAFMFAEFDALHDTFKGIDYLYSPSAGVGYKVIDTKITSLNVDTGVGGVVEKDTGSPATGSGAITFSEKLIHQLSASTTLKESVAGLLKMNDFPDGLYTFGAGVAARVNSRVQMSIDVLDTFKNRPVDGLTHKHDLALVTSVITKY
jgi:putative salt-induced outer membrane protein YdiY